MAKFGDALLEWVLKVLIPAAVVGAFAGAIAAHIVAVGITDAGKGAHLEVTSKPDHARVTIDGRLVGDTPIARVDLDPGKHAIVAELSGYGPYVSTIKLGPGASTNVEALLFTAEEEQTVARVVQTFNVPVVIPAPAGGPASSAPVVAANKKKPVQQQDEDDEDPPPRHQDYDPPPPPPVYHPPRRQCGEEKSDCDTRCWFNTNHCNDACPGCGSCTEEEEAQCKQQCDQCKQGCEQNNQFCKSSCEANETSCERYNDSLPD
jgi:hypothetical protein